MRPLVPRARRTALFLMIAVLAIGLGSRTARADGGLEYEAGAFVGAHFFSKTESLGYNLNGPAGNTLVNTGSFGARFALGLTSHFMFEGELSILPSQSAVALGQALVVEYGVHFLYNILDGRFRPFLLAGVNGESLIPEYASLLNSGSAVNFHAGVGAKFDFTERFGIRLDGRFLLVPDLKSNLGTEEYEVLLGLYGRLGRHGAAKPAVLDTDGDGIPDSEDRCPTQAGPKENGGCPDKDSDGDGIIDRLDKCPTQAGPKETDGCPDKDSDGDGIVDRLDKCPTQPGPKENGGCPDKDTDKDGIVNRLDKCPTEPETKNGYMDEDGCPDEVPKAVAQFTGTIQGITFETNTNIIRPPSFPILNKTAAVLLEHTSVHLEIDGHTDSQGKQQVNLALSRVRAEAVRDYLVSKGVAADRLTAVGFGPDKPIADNATAAGRAKNRRVEFHLVSAAPGNAPAADSGAPAQTAPAAAPKAPVAPAQTAPAAAPSAPAQTAPAATTGAPAQTVPMQVVPSQTVPAQKAPAAAATAPAAKEVPATEAPAEVKPKVKPPHGPPIPPFRMRGNPTE